MFKFYLHVYRLTDATDNQIHFISSFKLRRRCCTSVTVPRALMWNPLVLISTTDWWSVILSELSRLELKVSVPEGQTSLQLPVCHICLLWSQTPRLMT